MLCTYLFTESLDHSKSHPHRPPHAPTATLESETKADHHTCAECGEYSRRASCGLCHARGGRGPECSDWGNGAIGVVVVTLGASALVGVVLLSTVLVRGSLCTADTRDCRTAKDMCTYTCRRYRQAGGVGCIGMMVLGAHLW